MPHRCVRCKATYANNAPELKAGCACGAKVFIYLANEDAPSPKPSIENVRILEKGIFELDLASLGRDPLIVRDANGVYHVRLPKR